MTQERVVSLISGGGTTMEQMILGVQSGEVQGVEFGGVIASNSGAGGIEKAMKLGIPVEVVDPNDFRGDDRKIDQYGYGRKLFEVAHSRFGATVFTQNGHMPLTPEVFIEDMERVGQGGFNQHPGRVPDFGGKGMFGRRVHAATLYFRRATRGEMWTEPIAQKVHKNFDEGAVVGSQRVEILKGDTVDDLQQRVLPVEHLLQKRLLSDIGAGEVKEHPMDTILLPGQEVILEQAKRAAILLYPNG